MKACKKFFENNRRRKKPTAILDSQGSSEPSVWCIHETKWRTMYVRQEISRRTVTEMSFYKALERFDLENWEQFLSVRLKKNDLQAI